MPPPSPAVGERRAHPHFSCASHMTHTRTRAAIVRPAQLQVGLTAIGDDPGDGRERFGVVDGGGPPVQAVARRKRRSVARLPFLALDGFEQRRLLAADVGTPAMVRVQLEGEIAAHHLRADVARRARLRQRLLEALVDPPDFAVDVVVARRRPGGVPRYDHAFDAWCGL